MTQNSAIPNPAPAFVAFDGDRRVASGDLRSVARAAKEVLDRREEAAILVFDASSGPVELDFRGSVEDVLARLPKAAGAPLPISKAADAPPRGPGRPKLGVVAREITLLPRHWEWLARQPGGASVALRKLVDEARRTSQDKDRIRHAQETTYRFIAVMGGNKPHFEEIARALFAGDAERFEARTNDWPADVRDHARRLAAAAFDQGPSQKGVAS